jgi:hypothetical protein
MARSVRSLVGWVAWGVLLSGCGPLDKWTDNEAQGEGRITTTFYSSMDDGEDLPIRDLKVVLDSRHLEEVLPGYLSIPIDLNQGLEFGRYMTLVYTREPEVARQVEDCGGGPFITDLFAEAYTVSHHVKAVCYKNAYPLLRPAGNGNPDAWEIPDLNDGTGGLPIYAWQQRDPSRPPLVQVGVIVGTSKATQCPAGWTRVEQDLNEGAAGAYVYFCYRRRS